MRGLVAGIMGALCSLGVSARALADAPPGSIASPPAEPSSVAPAPHDVARKKPRDVKLGAMVGLGAPTGLDFGAAMRWKGLTGLRADFATIPSVPVPGVANAVMSRWAFEGGARVYPFRGAFFLGAAMGLAQSRGHLTTTVADQGQQATLAGTAVMKTLYAKPEVGMLWAWDFGLVIGCDVGAEIPLEPGHPVFQATADGVTQTVSGRGALANAMTWLGTHPVPAVGVIRVGFLL